MLSDYHTNTLETLYRQAVKLRINASGGPSLCEFACGRIGCQAHHVIRRSQEPALRWLYEPAFAALLCGGCHTRAHESPAEFFLELIAALRQTNPRKATCLTRFDEIHDRLRAPRVDWVWMRAYLRRCIARSDHHWADVYNRDE